MEKPAQRPPHPQARRGDAVSRETPRRYRTTFSRIIPARVTFFETTAATRSDGLMSSLG